MVVWWLAQHEDNPREVAASIDVLTELADAANNVRNNNDMNNMDRAAFGAPAEPPTPAERFDAFLDSLNPTPSDDVRLTLASQVARLVAGYDQKASDEMRWHHRRPDDDIADNNYGHLDEAEGTPPE